MSYPTSLDAFATKSNGDTIDASHINAPQTAIEALETKVGINSSADTNSLDYKLTQKEPLKGADDNYVTDAQLVVIGNTSGTNTGDNSANTSSIAHSLATAVNDFVVASGAGAFVKKTLAEVKTILGLGTAAYTDSTAYAPALGADDNYVTDAEKAALHPQETATTIGALIGGAEDATPNDTDFVATSLTAAGILKKITWTNVKAFLKTYFDTLYLGLTGGTMTGNITLGENASIDQDPVLSADGKYTGVAITGTAGATLAFGDLIYLDPTDSRWELADANAAAAADGDSRGVLGICILAAANDGDATKILLNGVVRADTAFPTMTINAPQYVSETAGDIVETQPTTTDVVIRFIGTAITADAIYFNPDRIYFTHT